MIEHEAFDFGITLDGRHHERIQCRVCCEDWPCLSARYADLEREHAALGAAHAELRAALTPMRSTGLDHAIVPCCIECNAMAYAAEEIEHVEGCSVPALLAAPGSTRGAELLAALETFADLAQLVLDRITNGVTDDERYLMKDAARIGMERYRALAGGRGRGGEG